jgi:5-methyltetrahydrofolate--homocysteine methyltransferase
MSADLLTEARQRLLVFDGAMGTLLLRGASQRGIACCAPEELLLSQPGMVADAHRDYLEAGADLVETNTFGGAAHILEAHGLGEQAREINRRAATLAREAARDFSTPRRPRFVVGSMGPGSRLPSLGQITFQELLDSYLPQALGLLEGGVDALLVETVQDLLQGKAVLFAIQEAFRALGKEVPVLVQVTFDRHGRMLTGSDASAVLAALESWPLASIGLNCGEGPEALAEPAAYLAQRSSRLVSLQPNAGLPRLVGEEAVYDLSPERFAEQMASLAGNPGLNFVGGCCGTTPQHIRALAQRVASIRPRIPQSIRLPALASLYQAQPIEVRPRPLLVGERSNASGSRAFKAAVLEGHWDQAVAVGLAQEQEGAHLLDLSVALAGRDEAADEARLASLFNQRARVPLMLDCTDLHALEEGLRSLAGRAVINSAHLEDGGRKARRVIELARRYGAALVLLCIDEEGMAKTVPRKLEVAVRLHDLALEGGLEPQDLFFDPLTFTLGSGDPGLRGAGRETLEALTGIKRHFPQSFTLLGVSNISYGLPPPARRLLNSVFLARAVERGLDAAILHAAQILPLHRVSAEDIALADDLIFDRPGGRVQPLEALLERFRQGGEGEMKPAGDIPADPGDRLRQAILLGEGAGLEETLSALLAAEPALSIIQGRLTPAMEEVGRLFENGQMLLPFVLHSAEIMRQATTFLQPHFGSCGAPSRGTLILATVRGDVHDIGKNLVGMILASNGFRVVDLGTRQPAEAILEAVRREPASAVGLSSLLVESARACRDYLAIFARAGLRLPVLLGGAAMTRAYVEEELQPLYPGPVRYASDAMDGLRCMLRIEDERILAEGQRPSFQQASSQPMEGGKISSPPRLSQPGRARRPIVLLHPPLEEVLPFLDRRTLYNLRWQLISPRAMGSERERQRERAHLTLERLLSKGREEALWDLRTLARPFAVKPEGATLVVLRPRSGKPWLRLRFAPRQLAPSAWASLGEEGCVGLQIVSIGLPASEEGNRLAAAYRVAEAFFWHGLCSELAEALAKWAERSLREAQGWRRTRRWSPGFPVWPELTEQRKVFRLLHPERIGLHLTEAMQIDPQYATSAIVFPIHGKEQAK